MTPDRILALLGIAIGLIGLFLAYYFYRRSVRTKVLGIAYTAAIPTITTAGRMVTFEGHELSSLSRTLILFWNRGTAPIESSDFIEPIKVTASGPIIKLDIFEKDPAAAVNINTNTNTIDIPLLRPGEAALIHVDIANSIQPPSIDVKMKTAEMSAFLSSYRGLYPLFARAAAVICALALALYFTKRTLGPTFDDPLDAKGAFLGMTISVIILVTSAGFGWATDKFMRAFLGRLVPRLPLKFFRIQAWVRPKKVKPSEE